MFPRKKPAADKQLTTDFKQRAPFAGYTPVDYTSYDPFLQFQPTLDGYLDKLFAAGSALDEGNKDAVDPLIADMAAKAEQHLEQQRIEHTDKIKGFDNRRSGDQQAFERQLETLRAALAQNAEELELIERRCKVAKF
ncbi:MAG: hypothetical protein LBJ11_05580 [Oscillospiraceae bacterium]|jgi:hypothetical protein|nr:hypothetical protein [Oscillospiraceae bacterium]